MDTIIDLPIRTVVAPAEVDAAEEVFAEAHGHVPDGYWRPLCEAALEAATEAGWKEFLARVDRDFGLEVAGGEPPC